MSALLVLAGYAVIIGSFGWLGAGAVAAHVALLVLGAKKRRP